MSHENINFLLEKNPRRRKYNRKRKNKFVKYLFILALMFTIPIMTIAISNSQEVNNISELEHEALSRKVEFNRLPETDETLQERMLILKNIIKDSRGTEEAQIAYWDLADLYLDSYDEPQIDLAISTLEEFLRNYPNSDWSVHFKLKLLDLYGDKNPKKTQLKNQLLKDNSLPSSLRSYLN